MSDLSTNPIYPYYPGDTASIGQAVTAQAASTSGADSGEFQQILAAMMMSSSMGSSSGTSGGMGDLMAPLMLILMEKLLSSQLGETQEEAGAAGSAMSLNGIQQYRTFDPSGQPYGRPIGGVLTQNYHASHNGLDFGIPVGTEVRATMDGRVTYAGWNEQGYGNLVIVDNGTYQTYYAHLSSIPVQVGDVVGAGAVIGLSGNTGNSTGPHLHYEIRRNHQAIDPTAWTLDVPPRW